MPMSKCRKRPWNLYKYKNYFFKKAYFSLIIEYGMYLKCLQKPRCLGWFKTSQALLSAVHKTRLNSSKDNFIAKSFRLSTKRKLSILLNFLFPFVSFIGVFSILKCKTLVLKTTTWWTRASHFVDGWHLLQCQIRFFPHPLNGWHDHWTFVGESGMGHFTDLVEIFFPNLSGVRNFSPRYKRYKIFFSALYVMSDISFSAGCFFPGIYLHAFFLQKSACRTFFFWNHP